MSVAIETRAPHGGQRLPVRRIMLVSLVMLATLLLTACGVAPTVGISGGANGGKGAATPAAAAAPPSASTRSSPGAADKDMTQTSDGGQVTIAATWEGRDKGPVFDIALNTHSVDLDGIDLAQSADLRTDKGVDVKPAAWEAPKGGHHRSGVLSFPTTTPDGKPLIANDTRVIQLTVRGVAGVPERVFRWELSS